jgi:acyl carrier protein
MAEESVTIEQLRKLLVDHLGCKPEAVQPEARLADDLGCDSLDVLELVMAAEERWLIEISDDEVPKAEGATVADVLALVSAKFEARHG